MNSIDDKERFELFYNESCEAYRHYSISIREIRIIAIVQGIVVLTGSGYLLQNKFYTGALAVAVFGIFLTLSLWRLHKTYYRNAMSYLEYITEQLEMNSGPWSNHKRFHKRRISRKFVHSILKDSIFILFLASNLILIVGVIYRVDLY